MIKQKRISFIIFFILCYSFCVYGQINLFSFFSSISRREPFTYVGYEPAPDDVSVFTKWTCSSFSPEPPQTYIRESPSTNTYETGFLDGFYAFERIGAQPKHSGIFRDPNGFDPSGNPFTSPSISSWVGGKNNPGFSYPSYSIISNRGIASVFGSAFGIINRRSSYSSFSIGPEIPLCSATMPTIISSDSCLLLPISGIFILLIQFILFII